MDDIDQRTTTRTGNERGSRHNKARQGAHIGQQRNRAENHRTTRDPAKSNLNGRKGETSTKRPNRPKLATPPPTADLLHGRMDDMDKRRRITRRHIPVGEKQKVGSKKGHNSTQQPTSEPKPLPRINP
jgi:hypothetical protein